MFARLPNVRCSFHGCAVRFAPEQLTLKALLALEEAAKRTSDAPVPPSYALRFALAYLYAIGDGERWPFDGFWQAVTRGWREPPQSGVEAIGRWQSANACLNGIYRAVRVERR